MRTGSAKEGSSQPLIITEGGGGGGGGEWGEGG